MSRGDARDEHPLEATSGAAVPVADTINHVETTQRPLSSRRERYLRFYDPHLHLSAPFGSDWFGRKAEKFARLFGTPAFLITQTAIVVAWIAVNALAVAYRWDPYPFILLNLAFSTQAAYAAPLILLAQTRQADRDKALAIADAEHRDALARVHLQRQDQAATQAEQHRLLLESNTRLTEQMEELTREIHARVCE
jgi:uncharacterized membrane protein